MKGLIAGFLVAGALALPSVASAHEFGGFRQTPWWSVNSNGTLTDNEAVWATIGAIGDNDNYRGGAYVWVFKKVNESAKWVRHVAPGQTQAKFQHICLIDVDRGSEHQHPAWPYVVVWTCHYGDWTAG